MAKDYLGSEDPAVYGSDKATLEYMKSLGVTVHAKYWYPQRVRVLGKPGKWWMVKTGPTNAEEKIFKTKKLAEGFVERHRSARHKSSR